MVDPLLADRHLLDRRIGAGMGEVWHAHDQLLEREVAVKLLHERGGHEAPAIARARFLREALALAQLKSPREPGSRSRYADRPDLLHLRR
ncbi:hypothetical protein AB0K52_14360 [Glycomyces sp. NPDC049804]|uniref:hypothetical protein n=1 Tax=Glycomyces sp. NPDC049804 TaxID=3154363 RepID=UPI0034418CA1